MAFVGEFRVFPWAATPQGWLACDGRLLDIATNQPLFAVIGTLYGGDGQQTFALPDLRGRAPLGCGPRVPAGQKGGEEAHALTADETPSHTHAVAAAPTAGTTPQPNGAVLAAAPIYGPPTDLTALQGASVSPAGGGAPHPNMQPFLALSFCINAEGMMPSGGRRCPARPTWGRSGWSGSTSRRRAGRCVPGSCSRSATTTASSSTFWAPPSAATAR